MKELNSDLFTLFGKAISKDDSRKALKHLYCDGENLVATDGKILVVHPCTDLEPGYYDLAKIKVDGRTILTVTPVTVEGDFPNYKQVIPNINTMKQFAVSFQTDKPLYPELFALWMEFGIAGISLADEMMDAVIDTFDAYTFSYTDDTCPVVFHNDTVQIIIMPLRRGGANLQADQRVTDALDRYRDHLEAGAGDQEPEPQPEPQPEPEPKRSRKSRKAA